METLNSVVKEMPSTDALFEGLGAGGTATNGGEDNPVSGLDASTEIVDELVDGDPKPLKEVEVNQGEGQQTEVPKQAEVDPVAPQNADEPPPPAPDEAEAAQDGNEDAAADVDANDQPDALEPEPEIQPEPIDLEAFNRDMMGARSRVAQQYQHHAVRIETEQTAIQQELARLKAGAVEEDPVTGEKRQRPYLPDELDVRDQLTDRLRASQREAQQYVAQIQQQQAVATAKTWTDYAVKAAPALSAFRGVVEQMAANGEIRAGADGTVDMGEVLALAQYRAGRAGSAPASVAPAKPQFTPQQVAQAQQNRQAQAIRERGLGTITAGKGTGGGNTPAKQTEPAYLKGAPDDVRDQLNKFDLHLQGAM